MSEITVFMTSISTVSRLKGDSFDGRSSARRFLSFLEEGIRPCLVDRGYSLWQEGFCSAVKTSILNESIDGKRGTA